MIIYRKMRHGIWILFLIEVPILFTGWYLANRSIKKHRKSIQKQNFVHISSASPRQRIQAGKNREEIYDGKFEGLDFKDLLTKIKNSNGRNLHVYISSDEKTTKTRVTLEYSALVFPQMIDISKAKKQSSSKKYIFVHSQYTDQLSKNTLAFLSLCAQAGKSGRKVVMPYVKQTKFSSAKSWFPLATYYDVKYLKRLLAAAGYASLVASAEYEKECPRDSPNHVSIHFIDNSQASMGFTKVNFRLKDDFYRAVVKNTTKNGWTKCEFLDRTMKRAPGKQFCVNGDMIKDWKVFEKNIVKNEKCLNIFLWRGIDGLRYRLKFSEDNYQFSSISLTFALRPGQAVINEVERFKKALGDKYIAVYVRSEKIMRKNSMQMEYLRQCVDLALEVCVHLFYYFLNVQDVPNEKWPMRNFGVHSSIATVYDHDICFTSTANFSRMNILNRVISVAITKIERPKF